MTTTELTLNQSDDQPQASSTLFQQYQSLLVPNLNVDIANYLTEILLVRSKKDLPKGIEFWRKEFATQYKDAAERYICELTQIKKLLKVFSPIVVVDYFKATPKLWTVRFLKKEESKDLIYNLFVNQYKYIQSLKDLKKTELEFVDDKLIVIEQAEVKSFKRKNKISKGL